jgi:hypothetical protein
MQQDRAVSSDPLPWLRLPKLDYVEVAGQKDQAREDFERGRMKNLSTTADPSLVVQQLEDLRGRMNQKIAQGDMDAAESLRQQLEAKMKNERRRL